MRSRPSNTLPLVLNVCKLPVRPALPGSHASAIPIVSRKDLRLRNERTPMSAHKLSGKLGFFAVLALAAVGALVSTPSAYAQIDSGLHDRARIIQAVNEADRV